MAAFPEMATPFLGEMRLDKSILAWIADIEERFEVTPDQRVLLMEAAAIRQRIANCERAIALDGLMVPARGGGTKVHPAARILENAEGLLLRYLKAMGLHEED